MLKEQWRGINLGGWLIMEGYILGGRNIPEGVFKSLLAKRLGQAYVNKFSRRFRASFITQADLNNIKQLGFNCVRLPFNFRLLRERGGLEYLKDAIKMCAAAQLHVILDMHAVPGAQNNQWHADSDGRVRFWASKKDQEIYFSLWQKLSRAFKDEPWIIGYDIMNEPVVENLPLLTKIFQQTVNLIRENNDQHLILLEGNNWGMDVDFVKNIKGHNLIISPHFYQPVEYTFNWNTSAGYPGREWLKARLQPYADLAQKCGRPVLIGEFGVASRCSHCHFEYQWVADTLSLFQEFNFHWSYWTYKSVAGQPLPDGLFQLNDTTGIVGNKATAAGMDNFLQLLPEREQEFFRLWSTDHFQLNQPLYGRIKPYLV